MFSSNTKEWKVSLSPGRIENSCISCLVWWLGRPAECLSHSPPSFPLNPPPSPLLWSRPAVVLGLTRHILRAPMTRNAVCQDDGNGCLNIWTLQTRTDSSDHATCAFHPSSEALNAIQKAWSFAYSAKSWEWSGMHSCQSMHTHTHTKITRRLSNTSSTSPPYLCRFWMIYFAVKGCKSVHAIYFYLNPRQRAHFSQ